MLRVWRLWRRICEPCSHRHSRAVTQPKPRAVMATQACVSLMGTSREPLSRCAWTRGTWTRHAASCIVHAHLTPSFSPSPTSPKTPRAQAPAPAPAPAPARAPAAVCLETVCGRASICRRCTACLRQSCSVWQCVESSLLGSLQLWWSFPCALRTGMAAEAAAAEAVHLVQPQQQQQECARWKRLSWPLSLLPGLPSAIRLSSFPKQAAPPHRTAGRSWSHALCCRHWRRRCMPSPQKLWRV